MIAAKVVFHGKYIEHTACAHVVWDLTETAEMLLCKSLNADVSFSMLCGFFNFYLFIYLFLGVDKPEAFCFGFQGHLFSQRRALGGRVHSPLTLRNVQRKVR